MGAVAAGSEWRDGWPVVVAGLIGMMLNSYHLTAVAALMKPLNEIYGWSRSQVSAGPMIYNVVVFIMNPVVGLLIPRCGIRRLALIGIVLISLLLALIGMTGPDVRSWYLAWALYGLGFPVAGMVIWTSAVNTVFDKSRGLALATAMAGTGLAFFVFPFLVAYVFSEFGWRAVFLTGGALGLLVYLPLIARLLPSLPSPSAQVEGAAAAAPASASGRWHQGLVNRAFLTVVSATVLVGGAVGTIGIHLQSILRDAGLTTVESAAYVTLVGPAMMVGRIGTGFLLDRLPPRFVAAGCFLLPLPVSLALAAYTGQPALAVVACLGLGLASGAEMDVLAYIISRYFGMARYPVVFAFVVGSFNLGYGFIPVLAAMVYDATGSYNPVLYVFAGTSVLSAMLMAMLGRQGLAQEDSNQPASAAPEVAGTLPEALAQQR